MDSVLLSEILSDAEKTYFRHLQPTPSCAAHLSVSCPPAAGIDAMAVATLNTTTTTTLVLVFISIVFLVMGRFRARDGAKKPIDPASIRPPSEAAQRLVDQLSSAFPDIVLLSSDGEIFEQSMNAYWAKQECEVVPCCVLRPTTTEQLSTAIKLLSREYHQRQRNGSGDDNEGIETGLFAIRSGGHSPKSHAASIEDGVLIDMGRFSDVVPAEDGSNVTIGVGAKWGKVYQVLDAKQLAVAGGRNSAVGVGGLILGGLSNFKLLYLDMSLHTIYRRYIVFFSEIWPCLLQYHQLRDRPSLRLH